MKLCDWRDPDVLYIDMHRSRTVPYLHIMGRGCRPNIIPLEYMSFVFRFDVTFYLHFKTTFTFLLLERFFDNKML